MSGGQTHKVVSSTLYHLFLFIPFISLCLFLFHSAHVHKMLLQTIEQDILNSSLLGEIDV